jgi:hypothetical protein
MTLWAGADHEVVSVEMTGVELRASRGMERRALHRGYARGSRVLEPSTCRV